MSSYFKHSDAEFADAVRLANTINEVGTILGLSYPNPKRIKQRIEQLGLDASHLRRWRQGLPARRYKRTLEDLLQANCRRDSDNVKQRLLREGVFPPECARCALRVWLDGPIPLQLDHIDGDKFNNTLSNLRLLCPNCHALTPTFCGRNVKNKRERVLLAAKLTEAQALEVYRRSISGETLRAISESFGISMAMVSRIKLKRAWRYLHK